MPTILLRREHWYKADLILSGLETLASNKTVGARFKAVGFQKVTVGGRGSKRTVMGRWSNPDRKATLPKQVVAVSEV